MQVRGTLSDILKEGTRHLSGLQQAVLKNIEAVNDMTHITRTSLGPNGQNKMVINHIGKHIVTSDAATMLKELSVEHPAAKLVILASEMQEKEIGDFTNYVVALTGELLVQSVALINMGLKTQEIVHGYETAGKLALEMIDELIVAELKQWTHEEVQKYLSTVIASKFFEYSGFLAELTAKACLMTSKKRDEKVIFNTDDVRVLKVVGGSVLDSFVENGLVVKGESDGEVKHVKDAKVAVYASGIDVASSETKSTVLFKNANDLLEYSKGEEAMIENLIKEIKDAGINVIVSSGVIGNMALHFMNKYEIMGVKVSSKFELRRISKVVGAIPLLKVATPETGNIGLASTVTVEEMGGDKVLRFIRNDTGAPPIATIVVRGSTANMLDDVNRALDDGINSFKVFTRDGRVVCGGGASEIELARKMKTHSETIKSLEQYAISRFAEALEVIPRTLAENAGLSAIEVITSLYANHESGNIHDGIDVENKSETGIIDMKKGEIYDSYLGKKYAMRYAIDAARTILNIDQIIMARAAGGPKVPQQGQRDI